MATIAGLSVLVVDDDPDAGELLQFFLEGQGARVHRADSAEAARATLAETSIDAILTDVSLPLEDGFAFVARLRADPLTRNIPVIAVTGYADARSRQRALAGGFQKFITKPFDVFALPAAIASVVGGNSDGPAAETNDERIARLIAGRDMRALLGSLNLPTEYRYTSILSFEAEVLQSVWTFDRADQSVDNFPADTPISASYCALVRAEGAPFAVADATGDPRVTPRPDRESVRAYCGVPIYRQDGSMYGTLCHFDELPRPIPEGTVTALTRVAELLAPALPPAERAAVAPASERD